MKTREIPTSQRERLSRWLREWDIDRVLPGSEEDNAAVHIAFTALPGELQKHVAPSSGERPIEPGQVRLISPALKAGHRLPLYVAILSGGKGKMYLVAPYSRFSEPALPGELLTHRSSACLRVLCLWNAVGVGVDIVGESWFVDKLSQRERKEALAVHRFVTGDGSLPPGLRRRTGPELVHPADPRHEYRREAKRTISDLAAGIHFSEAQQDNCLVWPDMQDGNRELPKVAEPRDDYDASGPPQEP